MSSLSIKLLEMMYCQHRLTDFLKKVEDTKQIENTIAMIYGDDITDTRSGVLSALYTELDYRKSSVRPIIKTREELIEMYKSKKLVSFLKGASEEEIKKYLVLIQSEGIKYVSEAGVYHLLLNAIREIDHNEYLAPKDANFKMTQEYYDLSRSISVKDVEFSKEYFERLDIDFEEFIKKCPIMMSIPAVSKIYTYFRRKGLSDEEVMEILVLYEEKEIYSKQLLEESKRLEITDTLLSTDEFNNFIKNSYTSLMDRENEKEKKQVKVALA